MRHPMADWAHQASGRSDAHANTNDRLGWQAVVAPLYTQRHGGWLPQDINLKTIATELNINPGYLGYLFKKETGYLFTNHLNYIRIEAAKKEWPLP